MTPDEAARRAELLLGIGRAAEARDILLAAGVPDEGTAASAFLLARAHLALNEPGRALVVADLGIAKAPEHEWGHRLRSIAIRSRGYHPHAIRSALDAVRLAPEEPLAYINLTHCYVAAHQYDLAVESSRRALELDPEAVNAHRAAAQVAIGLKQFHEAVEYCTRALALDPNNADAHNDLGQARLMLAETQAAQTHFQVAARLDPSGPGAENAGIVERRVVAEEARQARLARAARRRGLFRRR